MASEKEDNSAARFFYQHATNDHEYVADRIATAQTLASAEQWAREADITFDWVDDWAVGDHVAEFGDAYDKQPESCEGCIAHNCRRQVVASLWCIDDADTNYRRVIEAELAAEAKATIEAAISRSLLTQLGKVA